MTATFHPLPLPPSGRSGWPWETALLALPEHMPDGSPWPRISIVTPSYNQGRFIEETIRSVLLQGYPNLEFLVIDGGSTDDSVEIIRRYAPWLSYWESEHDRGQVHAINKGLERATGIWFNWLNSDDILLPKALATLAALAALAPQAQWISGGSLFLTEQGAPAELCLPWRTDALVIGLEYLSLPQDATFLRREFLLNSGVQLCEEAQVFDTILYLELIRYARPLFTTAPLSCMRLHAAQKTANLARRQSEWQRYIAPLLARRPFYVRLIDRLGRTRFHNLVRSAVWLATRMGLTPAVRAWQAAIFAHETFAWRIEPAHRHI